jgi:hypothetical protein
METRKLVDGVEAGLMMAMKILLVSRDFAGLRTE